MLTRELAHEGHYPAIDVLQSLSRLETRLLTDAERVAQARVRSLLSTHRRHREMVDMGLYKAGSNPGIDESLALMPRIDAFLRQGLEERAEAGDTHRRLIAALGGAR